MHEWNKLVTNVWASSAGKEEDITRHLAVWDYLRKHADEANRYGVKQLVK